MTVRIRADDGTTTDVAIERAGAATAGPCRVTITPEGAEGEAARAIEVEIERRAGGAGRLRIGGRVHPFHARRDGQRVWVWIDGRTHAFDIVPRTARRASAAGAAGVEADLKAPMPGRILEVRATAGSVYEAHAPLIVMESMKMEMTLSTPNAVIVREILCAEGALVEMGELLARLEPPPAFGGSLPRGADAAR